MNVMKNVSSLQPRSQGLSSSLPWSGRKERKKRDPGNEVEFFASYDMIANAPIWSSHFKTDYAPGRYLLKISTGQRHKSLPWIKTYWFRK